jgi:hypothetical protein
MQNPKLIVLYALILRAIHRTEGITRSEYGAVTQKARAKVWGEIDQTPLRDRFTWSSQDFERAAARLQRLGLIDIVRGEAGTKSSMSVAEHSVTLEHLFALELRDQATYAWLVLLERIDPNLNQLYIHGANPAVIASLLRECFPKLDREELADLALAVLELNETAQKLISRGA